MNPADKYELERLRARVFELERRQPPSSADATPSLSSLHWAVLDSMPEAVCVFDEEGRIVYTNASEDRMFGYERGELIGQRISAHDESIGSFSDFKGTEFEELERNGVWIGERLNRKKDGTPFYTNARFTSLTDHGKTYWLRVQEDATERRRIESELRRGNEALHALIVASPLPIVSFDGDGLIQLWNPAAERVFGWSEEEVLGKTLPFIPEDKRSEHLSMRQQDLLGQNFTNREVRRRKKDGNPIDIRVSTAPMHDSSGAITGIMSVYVDVTDQNRIAESQRYALDLLLNNEAQLTLLVEASGLLLASPESARVLDTILDLARKFVHAEAYAVWRKIGDTWRLMVSTGLSDSYERTIASDSAHYMRLPDQLHAVEDVFSQPGLENRAELYKAEGITSILTVPLHIHGDIGGTIVFYYRSTHVFSESERRIAGALGNLAASALSAAETYERQIEMRSLAEAAERRATFLAAVGEELASSLEYEVTLTKVARLAVPEFADWCAVDIVQPTGEIRRLAVQHADPEKMEIALEFGKRYSPSEDQLTQTVIRTGEPILLSEIPDALIAERARDAEHLSAIRSLGIRSVICAPMVVRGRTQGLITFATARSSRSFGVQDLSMAMEIARRAAVAVDNVSLFREVRESEERFRRLYEANIVGVAFWNANAELTSANDAYLKILGTSRQQFDHSNDRRWAQETPQEYQDTDEAILRECVENGASQVHEKEFVRADGTRAAVLIAAAYLNSLRKEGVVFIVDITERKKLDSQFRGVADAAVHISAASSVTEVLRTVNEWITRLLSCRQTDIRLTVAGLDTGAADLTVPLKDRSGEVIGVIRLWAGEGAEFTQTDRAIAVQLAEMAAAAIENTELNASLRRSNEELKRANEDLNQFAYSASHDLQEPLRMISIYTQLLGKRLASSDDEDIREFMRFTLDGAQRMEFLIRDLLAYTHAVNIRGVPESPIDANAALQRALANLRGAIESSGASIVMGALPSVRAYDVHLVQVFQNLIGNAIKYRGIDTPRVEISAAHDVESKHWVFRVQDNGMGIDSRYHQQVFGLFKRLYPAHRYPGTGIGLAICQKVVERYGGRIWVESNQGGGSRFVFTLPA